MFRRTSSCHQDFTPPPSPPPCGSEGQKATVCCPVVVQLLPTTRPPARDVAAGDTPRATGSRRNRRSPLRPPPTGGRIRWWQGVDSVGRPSWFWSSGEGKKDSCPAFFAGFFDPASCCFEKVPIPTWI